jgi:catechol 2,3-dioxygenase-like lactoylglutathione lyase family enzyme
MEPGHIELFVRDVAVSAAFYVDVLGFELVAEQGGGRFVWVGLGNREVLLRLGEPRPPAAAYERTDVGLVLYTDDVTADVERLRSAGVACEAMPGEPGCFTFCDPDGHWWQLVDPRHA